MKQTNVSLTISAMALALVAASAPSGNAAAEEAKAASVQHQAAHKKLVIQVSDADPKKWNLALNNAANVQQDLGKNNVDVEIVAYGPGLAMLKFDSEVGNGVKDAIGRGVKVVACENTMQKQKITREDLLPDIGFAKAGVVEIMNKQGEGYAYIRP